MAAGAYRLIRTLLTWGRRTMGNADFICAETYGDIKPRSVEIYDVRYQECYTLDMDACPSYI